MGGIPIAQTHLLCHSMYNKKDCFVYKSKLCLSQSVDKKLIGGKRKLLFSKTSSVVNSHT